jgi:triphosphoribosyl-dephospho-CoA synthase
VVTSSGVVAAVHVASAAQLACLLEVSAKKPGNVSPAHRFADIGYETFLASAAAIGGPLAGAATRPLGETVRLAVDSTFAWTRSNTNLGIVLLLAPLTRAALLNAEQPAAHRDLRLTARRVVEETTVADAREVYAAIRRASPGGLGRVDEHDVADEPEIPLIQAMRLAAGRDSIAREYATAFELTFELGAPALERARFDALSWDDAVVETFLTLLAQVADTHIVRRRGSARALEVSEQARQVLAAGGVRTADGRRAIKDMACQLSDGSRAANPGTTADLTTAAIFVMLVAGGWSEYAPIR